MDIEKFLHPWDKSHFIMVYDPFDNIAGFDLLVYCRVFSCKYLLVIEACSFVLLLFLPMSVACGSFQARGPTCATVVIQATEMTMLDS